MSTFDPRLMKLDIAVLNLLRVLDPDENNVSGPWSPDVNQLIKLIENVNGAPASAAQLEAAKARYREWMR